MSQLNDKLLAACTDQFHGYELISDLLTAGAEPLGHVIDRYGDDDNLFNAVVEDCWMGEEYDKLFVITQLFCQHGMDISKPAIPYDDANILNPVSHFTVLMDDGALPTLKYLLDRGLDIESAFSCWHHAVEYWFFVDGSLEDERSRKQVMSDLRKILLIASYPYILESDDYLQEIVWLDQNEYDITKLRDWTKYSIAIDDSRCGSYPHVINSLFTLTDIESGQVVWKVGFGRQDKKAESNKNERN